MLTAPIRAGAAPAEPARRAPRVLVLGDSLSAEYGLARGEGWVAHLARRAGTKIEFINASISGDTTAGGRSRLPALLAEHRPDVVVLELGANDALRGLALDASEANLDAMVVASQQAGARVLVLGMQVPPNYGRRYTDRFAELFAAVAERRKTAFVPFLLARIADDRNNFQADQIHPNAGAQAQLADTVWSRLAPLINR